MKQSQPFADVFDDDHELFKPNLTRVKPAAMRPDIRSKLHAICALYAHSTNPKTRVEILDRLEQLTMQAAMMLAVDLLENGWQDCDEV